MMKKLLNVFIVLLFSMTILLSGCIENNNSSNTSSDLLDYSFEGKYISIDDEVNGMLTITNTGYRYIIVIELYDMATITAEGQVENGTLVYNGADEYGNHFYGNIDEYGNDYPIRVEFNSEGLFDEVEFEKQ